MRTDASAFATKNLASAKSPRFVVKIEYSASSLYLSSHNDISGIPATHIVGCLMEPSISSQKLNPDQGRAEIGAASFSVVDLAGEFSDEVRTLYAAGEGLRDRLCKFYLGYEGLAWSAFMLVGTQNVKEASYDKGSYRISCNDVQRAARKDIFDLATTTIASTVEAADTTINVATTTGFTKVKHGTSYTDAASSTVGYIKIKDEVIRYTGSTSTSFTGCTRGVLGTIAARYVADGGTAAARREKVTEYVYLELPAAKLAYALLTGVLYGDSANLPTTWHLGISSSLIRLADFTGIGADVWNTADDTLGIVLRFEGLTKVDGKAFIETEIMRLIGHYLPVYATGELGLRRMTRVLSDAAAVVTLDESNSVTVGDLEHDMESLYNAFQIQWNWNGKDYSRTTTYLDASSVAKHGRAPTMELKFKGLYGGRHTDGQLLKLLDSIRDRYSAPPVRLRVDVLHSLNRIEVGDVVRVAHAQLRDFTGSGATIDRSFEVQSVTINHRTGAVSLDLFGSTSRASVVSPTVDTVALPDGFYTAQGTNLTAVATITAGVMATGSYTLTGGTDLTAAGSTWYYNGDLTIPVGCTLNISGNVQLRIKGYLTVNGTITGVGGGLAGVADDTTPTSLLTGNPGYVGNSRGSDGLLIYDVEVGGSKLATKAPATTVGKNQSFPMLALEVSGTTLRGLPTDIRGTGGGPGGKVVRNSGTQNAAGGTGGAGGAGLATISRGLGLGANALINLSGANTAAPSAYSVDLGNGPIGFYPGTGAPGGPGGYLCLLDGSLLSVPDLAGRVRLRTGTLALPPAQTFVTAEKTKYKNALKPFAGQEDPSVTSDVDLSFSASRIQYVPAPETAAADIAWPPADLGDMVPDPRFALSTGQDFWYWGTYTGVSISLTGGVSGGRLILTGNSTAKYVYVNRAPLAKAVTSQQYSVRVRWRRTGTISGTASIDIGGETCDAVPANYSMSMSGAFTIGSINSATVNEWQESTGTLTVANLPKNQNQLPFVTFVIYMGAATTGGTVEISDFVVTPI